MEEVLNDVLQAEKTAEQSVRDANAKRDEKRSTIEAEINEMLNEAKTTLQRSIRDHIQSAKIEASKDREEAIKVAEDEAAHFAETNADSITAVVDEVCSLIVTPELPG